MSNHWEISQDKNLISSSVSLYICLFQFIFIYEKVFFKVGLSKFLKNKTFTSTGQMVTKIEQKIWLTSKWCQNNQNGKYEFTEAKFYVFIYFRVDPPFANLLVHYWLPNKISRKLIDDKEGVLRKTPSCIDSVN